VNGDRVCAPHKTEAARLQLAEAEAQAAEVQRSVEAAAQQLKKLDKLETKLSALSVPTVNQELAVASAQGSLRLHAG
jgi:hypothetical protein